MSNMTPTSTSSFPTMGDEAYTGLVNVSGQRSPYTMPEARKGPTSPDMGGSPAAHRSAGMVHETMGPCFRPVASRLYQGDEGTRAIRTMPSRAGVSDFWNQRQDGEVIG